MQDDFLSLAVYRTMDESKRTGLQKDMLAKGAKTSMKDEEIKRMKRRRG